MTEELNNLYLSLEKHYKENRSRLNLEIQKEVDGSENPTLKRSYEANIILIKYSMFKIERYGKDALLSLPEGGVNDFDVLLQFINDIDSILVLFLKNEMISNDYNKDYFFSLLLERIIQVSDIFSKEPEKYNMVFQKYLEDDIADDMVNVLSWIDDNIGEDTLKKQSVILSAFSNIIFKRGLRTNVMISGRDIDDLTAKLLSVLDNVHMKTGKDYDGMKKNRLYLLSNFIFKND